MRRGDVLVLPAATLATPLLTQTGRPAPQPALAGDDGQGDAPPAPARLPRRWVEGEERFVRPYVQASARGVRHRAEAAEWKR